MANTPRTIQAGRLRHVVQIMSPATQQGLMGGPVTADMVAFATLRASIESLQGRELYSAQQMVAEVTHKVTVRWCAGIKAKMDVWFSTGSPSVTRQFQILYVLNTDELNKKLVLFCVERDDSAYEVPGQ